MAELTAKARKALPSKDFAEPGKRKFPVEDKAHARSAKSRASEAEHKGKISKSTEKKIDAKADKVLDKGKSHKEISPKGERESMNIRRVANGYIVRHQGKDGMESEHYTDEAPKVRVRR